MIACLGHSVCPVLVSGEYASDRGKGKHKRLGVDLEGRRE